MRLQITVLGLFASLVSGQTNRALIIADEIPAMEVLAKQLKTRAGVESTIVKQEDLPPDPSAYPTVFIYIHRDITPATEQACIAYANGGGKLILLHHSISSGKRANPDWFQFLGVELPLRDFKDGGYKYFDPATFTIFNIAPGNWITTHDVKYDRDAEFTLPDTEVYLNHNLTGARTLLLGLRYKEFRQNTAGWYKPAGKGLVFYFMAGHRAEDFDHPAYAQIIANAVQFQIER